jgi:PAS domain S-box-containing protein
MDATERRQLLRPARIALVYVFLAGAWIVGSDYLVNRVLRMPTLHSYKGIFFVLATGALLYWMLARAEAGMRASHLHLRSSRERFELLVESAPEAVFIQTGGCFRYLNPAALRLFAALDARQMLGRRVLDFVAPDHRDAVQERIGFLNHERRAAPPREQVMLRLDGSPVEVEASAAAMEIDGQYGAVVFIRDISGRKIAERHEEQLREQIRQAQKMESLGRLAGGVAHDFNNLLTVINGYADMLLEDLSRDHPLTQCAQEIRDAGERAASLTRQLLAFSRKDVGERRILDINAVIRDSERMLNRLVGENISVATSLDDAIGTVWSDPAWIHQMLLNLVVNSRDAMPDGGLIEIRTADAVVSEAQCRSHSEASPGRYVRLSVVDSGIGMPSEVLAHAFEPFFTTKPAWQGTGLGLSTVYGIVHNCGGWITADSRPGEGATMNLWLPVREGPVDARSALAEHDRLRGDETILLVEDDPVVRVATANMLRRYGYGVVAAGDGVEAVRLATEWSGRIDLVLSDVVMPGMNGPETAAQLRSRRPGVKVLLMSGYRPDELREVAAELPFIAKPFTATTLARRVRAVLDGA